VKDDLHIRQLVNCQRIHKRSLLFFN